jgi:hypothetical protein
VPIRAENKRRYPTEWPLISVWVRVCAGWRCEWCGAVQGSPTRASGGKRPVVLTVAHVRDPAPENATPDNLAALCQACHLALDRRHHVEVARRNRRRALGVLEMAL